MGGPPAGGGGLGEGLETPHRKILSCYEMFHAESLGPGLFLDRAGSG